MTMSRPLVLIVAGALALAAWDFFSRVYVGRDATLREISVPNLAPVPSRPDVKAVRAQLGRWLPGLHGTEIVAADTSNPAAWDIALTGIFRSGGERFAVVQVRPRAGGAAETTRVREGEELHGAKVLEIGSKSLRLEEGETSREVVLFEYGGSPIEPVAATTSPGAEMALSPGTAAEPSRTAGAPVAAPAGSSAGRRVMEARPLQPGEEVKLPWDLPVVEEAQPSVTKKP